MKTKTSFIVLFFSCYSLFAQLEINSVLAAGVEDAQVFTENYFGTGLDALVFSFTNGWFTSAKSKKLGQFEVSFVGNVAKVSNNQNNFQLNTSDYNFLQFQSSASIQNVANVLGENNPNIQALVLFQDENGNEESLTFDLPQGIADSGLDFVPTAFPQLSVGFVAGFEFKIRYLPEINTDNGTIEFYGVGVQNEISSWIPVFKLLPFHIAIAANYTQFTGNVTLSETPIVDSNNGTLRSEFSAWSCSGIISTKLPVINFYAGISYVRASVDYGLKGDFDINQGVNAGEIIQDPFNISSTINGFRSTFGAKLTLAFFRINVDYNIQEFNTLSAGISFGI